MISEDDVPSLAPADDDLFAEVDDAGSEHNGGDVRGGGRIPPAPERVGHPVIVTRPEHDISRKDIDHRVVRLLYRLHHQGYEAYLVGGAVRDFLQGHKPKDFDIATNATPEEVRRLFRNSRIIGRRFRLVHVTFGREYVEVATLRQQVGDDEGAALSVNDSDSNELYVNDDNAWGDVESDAFRRDFTINALFYDIADFSILDYTGGLADLKQRLIRAIGDPDVRFREDPVRMLRAVKFAARFDYQLEEKTAAAMSRQAPTITDANSHRLVEELFRILGQKRPHHGMQLLQRYGLLQALYPQWYDTVGADDGVAQIIEILQRVHAHRVTGQYLPLECLCAVLFIPLLGRC